MAEKIFMLNFKDKRWNELKNAYGEIYNPTNALLKLKSNTEQENIWTEFWNELHHQGDIGDVAFAVVPHLIRIHAQKIH